jgi:hypothetical protein
MIATILTSFFCLSAILWLAKARTAALLANVLILFGLTYRTIDIAYLDIAGPIYSTQLEKFVGGNGAAPFFVLSVLCFVIPAAVAFRKQSLTAGIASPLPNYPYLRFAWRGGFVVVAALLAILYADMLRIGVIPLISGMDRTEYGEIAGIFHRATYGLGFLPAAAIGILTVLPRLQGRTYSVPAIFLLLILLMYWALTGNRFSAFVVAISYFALPFAAVVVLADRDQLRMRSVSPWAAIVSIRVVLPIMGAFALIAVGGLIANSYNEVRNYADPVFELTQRIFVQPVEIFASRWELASNLQAGEFNGQAIDEVLLNPVEGEGNTTMRYLMIQELGYFRAVELINFGTQYAGGYPEIFFELFGLYAAIPLMLALGIGMVFLSRLAIRNLMNGYIGSAMMTIYIMFAFTLGYVGGMLNSLMAPSLAIKILGLIIISIFERGVIKQQQQALAAQSRDRLTPNRYAEWSPAAGN